MKRRGGGGIRRAFSGNIQNNKLERSESDNATAGTRPFSSVRCAHISIPGTAHADPMANVCKF